jgi:nitrite reductase (NO-forming)
MSLGRDNRVIESHSILRLTLRLAGVFAVASVIWAVVVLIRGGSWWGPLHTFLAGTVLLAISGASQMFTITWAAASPPSQRLAGLQRWAVAGGAVLVLTGVTSRVPILVWIGATAVAAGLAVLAFSITGAIRRSLLRRFDLSARFYLTAIASGVVGVAIGAALGAGWVAPTNHAALQLVHSHLNLLGLVGLTIIGTLPTFLPTIAHHRTVSRGEAVLAWWLGLAGVVVIGVGLWTSVAVGVGSILIAAAALLVTTGIVARLWEKGRTRLGFLQIVLGVVWLAAWAVVDGIGILVTGNSPGLSGWTAAAVVAGVGQVLVGSLTYLIPVLLGPPLTPASTILTRRSWLPLVTLNLAGFSLIAGLAFPAVAALGLWLVDTGIRTGLLIRQRLTPTD